MGRDAQRERGIHCVSSRDRKVEVGSAGQRLDPGGDGQKGLYQRGRCSRDPRSEGGQPVLRPSGQASFLACWRRREASVGRSMGNAVTQGVVVDRLGCAGPLSFITSERDSWEVSALTQLLPGFLHVWGQWGPGVGTGRQ